MDDKDKNDGCNVDATHLTGRPTGAARLLFSSQLAPLDIYVDPRKAISLYFASPRRTNKIHSTQSDF